MRLRRQRGRSRPVAAALTLGIGLATLLGLLGSYQPASAHTARYIFTASVMRFETSLDILASALAEGDILAGTLAYDPHLTDEADGPEEGHYREEAFTGHYRISLSQDDFSVKTVENVQLPTVGSSLLVQNGPELDAFTFISPHVDTRPSIVGLPGVDFLEAQLSFTDSTGTALESDALPESLDLSAFDSAWLSVFAEDFAGRGNPLVLDAVITSLMTIAVLEGDYNADEAVDQADLDLVLFHWGNATPPIPHGWVNDLPDGPIDQRELDSVLLSWGISFAAAAGNASAIPEPSSVILAIHAVVIWSAIGVRRCVAAFLFHRPGRPRRSSARLSA